MEREALPVIFTALPMLSGLPLQFLRFAPLLISSRPAEAFTNGSELLTPAPSRAISVSLKIAPPDTLNSSPL